MKKRIKIKKIILSFFTFICLGLGLIAPFINNNDIIVSALSPNVAEFTSNGFTYSQTVFQLDGTEDFISEYYMPIESADNLQSLPNNTKIDFRAISYNGFTTGDDFYYYFDNVGFGTSYGFSISGYTGFFNGFYFELNSSGTGYIIYLANLSYNSSGFPISNNEIELTDTDIYYFTYSSTDEISIKSYGITSNVGIFNSWFYNNFIFYFNNTYTMGKWANGSVISFSVIDYFNLIDYFDINRNLVSSYGAYLQFHTNGDIYCGNTLICDDGILNNYYYTISGTPNIVFVNMTLNELSFIYTICSFNFYPSGLDCTFINFPNYYRLDKLNSINYSINNFTMSFANLDGDDITDITRISYDDETAKISFYYQSTSTIVVDKYTNIWYSPFSSSNNYFYFNGSFTTQSYNANQLLYIGTPYEYLPQDVKGWYTFDIAPFDSITGSVDIDLDISFTSDSQGYNNLRIIAGTEQGIYVGRIYYRNLDSDRNVINEYVPYQYSRLPYDSDWTTYNARQLFFDETLIDGNVYNTLNDMGVFTFISNNPNNNQTMVDLFWGIAEVPIVTVRKVFDFEILGTNVSNFIMSSITISIILFLIRRLF